MRYKKANRIMMIAVSLLLALVLLTTCVLSGIYAKYVTQSKTETKIKLKQFGITFSVELDDDFKTHSGANIKSHTEPNSVVIEANNLTLKPGDDFSDAVKFSFEGTAEVPVNVKIAMEIIPSTEEGEDFKVPAGIGGLTTETELIPYDFRLGIYDNNSTAGTNGIKYSSIADIKTTARTSADLAQKMAGQFYGMTPNGNYLCKRFEANTNILFSHNTATNVTANYFYMGIYWNTSVKYGMVDYKVGSSYYGQEDNYNEICTWLTQNKNPKLTVKYIVTLEQADS